MKKLFISIAVLKAGLHLAQVGIQTANPSGLFHIDGNKNNPLSGQPSVLQSSDDFIITTDGKVGIGTVNPSQKLQIIGDNVNHPLIISPSPNLPSGNHSELLAIDDWGNVGIKSSVGALASVFTIRSEVRGLDMTNGGSNVNIPLSNDNLIFNTLSANVGVDNISGSLHSYIVIPKSGVYEIQVLGAFNCSTSGIWGMNLQMRKGIVSGGNVTYSIIETRRLASTFIGTTNAIPGRIYGEYTFNAGDRINFRLATGKTYSGSTPDCGSVNISGVSSGVKIMMTKVD